MPHYEPGSRRTHPTSSAILEVEDLYRFAGNSTYTEPTAGHASYSGCLVGHDLALAPLAHLDICACDLLELVPPAVVLTRSVVPMPAIGRLELDAAESIPNRLNGAAPDKNGGC